MAEETRFKKWVLDRGSCRSSATKFVSSYMRPTEVSEAQAAVSKCENLMSKLSAFDEKISQYKIDNKLISDEQYNAEYFECDAYQDKLLKLMIVAKGHVSELSTSTINDSACPTKVSYRKL